MALHLNLGCGGQIRQDNHQVIWGVAISQFFEDGGGGGQRRIKKMKVKESKANFNEGFEDLGTVFTTVNGQR